MTNKICEDTKNFIKKFEGLQLTAYICPAGYKTIGYGHLVKPGESYEQIDETIADQLLENDLKIFANYITKLVNRPLKHNQFIALVSFTFNLGAAAFARSTLRQKINRYEDQDAAFEFLKWTYAKGKKLKGLVIRRQAEANLFAV